MRITTNMVMRNYQNSLYDNLGGLESARKQVDTEMRISSAYEDPGAAANAAVLKSRYARNEDYLNNLKSVEKWFDEQESAVYQVGQITTQIADNYSIAALTDTAGETGRDTYAEQLRNLQNTMVQFLNSKFGDTFVLGGNAGTQDAPFELSDDGKTLLYRGVDVNDPANAAVLDRLASETSFVDIGYGMTFDAAGNIVPSTALDASLPGITEVGYGQNADGTSQNLVLLAGQMAELLEADTFDREEYEKLWTQFKAGADELQDSLTKIGTKTNMVETTISKLEDEKIAIQDQFNNEIGIDPALAITNYSYAMYTYNSALKVGTGILGPSLLDFLA